MVDDLVDDLKPMTSEVTDCQAWSMTSEVTDQAWSMTSEVAGQAWSMTSEVAE
ncbi:MAG: hypothetical protein IK087_03045 [Lachnospiraceae bacterium]|nr:hypothetical protein [Lachnospiraceae bacterium]